MSRRLSVLLALVSVAACLAVLPAASAGELSHARIVRVSYTQGAVQYRADADARWQNAIVNTPLREGMSLATGDGRAEVEFESGAMLWIARDTVVEFQQLALDEGAKLTQVGVTQGTATIYVKPGKHDTFAVMAGGMLVEAPEAARFRVDVFEDGSAVSVLRGAVEVTSRGEQQRVSSHKTLAVRDEEMAGATVSSNPHSDAWDRWVSDRDNSVESARMQASDTLAAPFGYGMADLSFYGGWVNVGGYGLAWQPYGVGAGWSPFFNGYWTSFGAFGPTWVSYEPWGWLPYHYGGWVFSPGYGWLWVPGSLGFGAWNPGTVWWVRSPVGVAWVPRGPRENGSGRPANLTRGVITNTTAGMLDRTANTVVRGGQFTGAQTVASWKNDAELVRFSQQAGAQSHAAGGATPGGARHGMRMPEGPAPRIATAGTYAGRTERYTPPVPMRGASGGGNRSGGAAPGRARGYSAPQVHGGAPPPPPPHVTPSTPRGKP